MIFLVVPSDIAADGTLSLNSSSSEFWIDDFER